SSFPEAFLTQVPTASTPKLIFDSRPAQSQVRAMCSPSLMASTAGSPGTRRVGTQHWARSISTFNSVGAACGRLDDVRYDASCWFRIVEEHSRRPVVYP